MKDFADILVIIPSYLSRYITLLLTAVSLVRVQLEELLDSGIKTSMLVLTLFVF